MSVKRPESVLVLIVDEQENVLLMQRNDDPDFWQSVTGTMEESELPIQTAYREVNEETGIRLDDKKHQLIDCRIINQYRIRESWLHRYPHGTEFNDEYVFYVKVPVGTPVSLSEHTDYQWLPKQAALDLAWSESNRYAIDAFVRDEL